MVIIRNGPGLDTKVYVKPANAVADPGGGVRPPIFRPGPKKNFLEKKDMRKRAKKSDFLEFYRKGQVKVTT